MKQDDLQHWYSREVLLAKVPQQKNHDLVAFTHTPSFLAAPSVALDSPTPLALLAPKVIASLLWSSLQSFFERPWKSFRVLILDIYSGISSEESERTLNFGQWKVLPLVFNFNFNNSNTVFVKQVLQSHTLLLSFLGVLFGRLQPFHFKIVDFKLAHLVLFFHDLLLPFFECLMHRGTDFLTNSVIEP